MSDYYHELTGSPEESPEYERAVEIYLSVFPGQLRKATPEHLEDLLADLEPDRDEETATDAWQQAVPEFRDSLAEPPCAWCDSPSVGVAKHNDGLTHPACAEHGIRA